jgi:septal ring factor EnvC (AmiA/AmiB activator)
MQSIPIDAAQSSKQSKAELKKLQNTLKKLQTDLKKERSKRSSEETSLQQNEQSIAALALEITEIDEKLKKLNKNLDGFLVNREQLQSQLDQQLSNLKLLLVQRYQMGDQSPIKLLLSQQQPEQINRMLVYLNEIQQYQSEKIVNYQTLLTKQAQNNNDIDKTQSELVKDKTALQDKQNKLELTREQRKKTLLAINSAINQKQSKINKLAADKKRLERVIVTIEKAIANTKKVIDKRPFAKLKGKLPWPTQGKIARSFGSIENNLAYDGILIRGSQRASVKAVHTGKVVFSDWLRSYGMLIIIDHGSGYLSLYGHNDQLNKKVGDNVAPGETIALVGSSGGNQRAGLYFAVRRNGQSVDPKSWLSGR